MMTFGKHALAQADSHTFQAGRLAAATAELITTDELIVNGVDLKEALDRYINALDIADSFLVTLREAIAAARSGECENCLKNAKTLVEAANKAAETVAKQDADAEAAKKSISDMIASLFGKAPTSPLDAFKEPEELAKAAEPEKTVDPVAKAVEELKAAALKFKPDAQVEIPDASEIPPEIMAMIKQFEAQGIKVVGVGRLKL